MAMTDLQYIRLQTTSDTGVLSDATINLFIAEYSGESAGDQRKLAWADCLEYMARDDVYESYSRGGISVGRNRLVDKAARLRAEVGVTIQTDELVIEGFDETDENAFA